MITLNLVLGVLVALFVAGALYYVARSILRAYLTYHGRSVVTCPETQQPAGVEVDAKHAAATAAFGQPELRLQSCSRWPERAHCGQTCLDQIEASPEDCLVVALLEKWYRGKDCAFCGRTFDVIHWHDHKPALLDPDGHTVAWAEVPAALVPHVLETHRPVCWNCHVAESFRHEHPDLVVDRPWPKDRHPHPHA